MITYTKLFDLMKKQGKNTSHIRKENIIGQETLRKLKIGTGILEEYDFVVTPGNKKEGKDPVKEKRVRETSVDTKAIENLCKWLNCQPSDIMEFIPNTQENADRLCDILDCEKADLPKLLSME